MNKTLATLIAILIPLAPCMAQTQTPKAPAGYQWVSFPEVKAYFLKPDGWHFQKQSQSATITKERYAGASSHQTGMTVKVIRNVPQTQGTSALKYALALRDKARTQATMDREWETNNGPFHSVGYVCTQKGYANTFRSHNVMVFSVRTSTIYLVAFEAPVAEWPAAWMTAEPIIQKLYLDDEI